MKPTDTAVSVEEGHVERAVPLVFSCTPAPTCDCAVHSADCCRSSRVPSAQCSVHSVRSPLSAHHTRCKITTICGNTSHQIMMTMMKAMTRHLNGKRTAVIITQCLCHRGPMQWNSLPEQLRQPDITF